MIYVYPAKDKKVGAKKRNVIHIIQCPDCHNDHVSKTEKTVKNRSSGHKKKKDQPIKEQWKKKQLFIDYQTFSQILG